MRKELLLSLAATLFALGAVTERMQATAWCGSAY